VPGWVFSAFVAAIVMAGTAATMGQRASQAGSAASPVSDALTAAQRPRIPNDPAQIWLVPDRTAARPAGKAVTDFATGVRLFDEGKYAQALPLLNAASLASTPVAAWAAYYTGLAYSNLSRPAEARASFAQARTRQAGGYLSDAAIGREAEAAVAMGDHAEAARLYEVLAGRKTAAPDAVLLALGRARLASGDRQRAAESFAKIYYEYPLGEPAAAAEAELDDFKDLQAAKEPAARARLEFGRAERLYAGRRYPTARQAFERSLPLLNGDERELAGVRIGECDYYLRRYRQAQTELGRYVDQGNRQAEARFYVLSAARDVGDHDEYVRQVRSLVAAMPTSPWAEDALNGLATHYVVGDEDEQADAVFRELYGAYPQGRHAERAAWRAGWWAYRHQQFADAATYFEGAAATFPRSDYRPAYLYWSARSRERTGDGAGAAAVYRIVTADYLNSYYGRLAAKRAPVAASSDAGATPASNGTAGVAPPPNAELIRLLVAVEAYDAAREELLFAQRTWGDNPAVGATLGWVYNRQGDYLKGIIAMKRAYPQYMAAGASHLPVEALRVIFPIDYWPLIKQYSAANGLDPYLVAALINQESAFDADAKSAANAIGLMQLLPSTGRRYAKVVRLKRYATSSLTRPEVNIQLGTAYFSELVRRFGSVHCALVGYNAGENRVVAWSVDRAGLERDEYIDDIPFPETQGYVKKILGTAEDYRRLYGEGAEPAAKPAAKKAKTPPPKAPPKRKK
jgi:soluble lytic murein transglycosylase